MIELIKALYWRHRKSSLWGECDQKSST